MTSLAFERLRRRVAALEGSGRDQRGPALALGLAELDRRLPWGGLKTGAPHEIAPASLAADHDGAALGFAAFCLGGLVRMTGKPALWLAESSLPHAPGLVEFGLDPARLAVGLARKPKSMLWALEEAVRAKALAGVLGEIRGIDLTAARRLHLAARDSGTTVILLNRAASAVGPALTRWRVSGLPGGECRWRLELLRCRGRAPDESGRVDQWEVEWNGTARRLGLAAPAGDGSAVPEPARVA